MKRTNDVDAFSSRTFKSGNGVALRLPRALGIAADVEMWIERDGEALVVRPAGKPATPKATVTRLIEALNALPTPGEIQPREPITFPDRPGLI